MKSQSDKLNQRVRVLQELVSKTETVLKCIEQTSDKLYLPLLYQWRYATSHLVRFISIDERDLKKREKELESAIAHITRSYNDSILLLLEYFIDRAYKFYRVAIPERDKFGMGGDQFDEMRNTLLEAYRVRTEMRIETSFHQDDLFRDSSALVERIEAALSMLSVYEPVAALCRRRVIRAQLMNFILGVVTVAATVLAFFAPRYFHGLQIWR